MLSTIVSGVTVDVVVVLVLILALSGALVVVAFTNVGSKAAACAAKELEMLKKIITFAAKNPV